MITATPVPGIQFFEWSPDGGSLVITNSAARLLRFDATQRAEPAVIVERGSPDMGIDWNNQVGSLFRPPDGQQIAYLGVERGAEVLIVANADGSNPTVTVGQDDLRYVDLLWPSWSPDGSTIAFTAAAGEPRPVPRLPRRRGRIRLPPPDHDARGCQRRHAGLVARWPIHRDAALVQP